MALQFERIQKYDAQITFAQPQPETMASEVLSEGMYEKVEPVLQYLLLWSTKARTIPRWLSGFLLRLNCTDCIPPAEKR